MVKAEQHGADIVKMFIKIFAIICPMSILASSIGSVVYSQWKYGFINPNKLYRPYRLVYVTEMFMYH